MYEGVNASDGIGIGVARVAVEPDLSFTPHAPEDPEAEKARYAAAVEKFVEQTNAQIERMKQTVGEDAAAIMAPTSSLPRTRASARWSRAPSTLACAPSRL